MRKTRSLLKRSAVAAVVLGFAAVLVTITISTNNWLTPTPKAPDNDWSDVRLLDLKGAQNYIDFWRRREPRLASAAGRLGWNQTQSNRARTLIEAARARFESLEIAYLAWGKDPGMNYPALERAVDNVYDELKTFCDEFRLDCLRGVAPDQVKPKRRLKSRPGGRYGRAIFLWPGSADPLRSNRANAAVTLD